jgi:putative PIN family toxin of toxin-antitoxin system
MLIVIDTNVLLRMFGRRAQHREIRDALLNGRISWAVSTDVLLEYEEVVSEKSGTAAWQRIRSLMTLLSLRFGSILEMEPAYRFQLISTDPDDNKFVDCAIAANADFVVTEDAHFAPLATAGYKPHPISPAEFVERVLTDH